jgi:hypothetical protein
MAILAARAGSVVGASRSATLLRFGPAILAIWRADCVLDLARRVTDMEDHGSSGSVRAVEAMPS